MSATAISKKFIYISFILYIGLVLLVYKKHINIPDYDWRCEIFADQSGYYVYLPGTIIYNLDATSFPSEIVQKTGLGFKLDSTGKKFITKYTYGVALLQLPFFLIIHYLAKIGHLSTDGFSHIYQEVPNLAITFYTLLSFIFIYKFLRYYFSKNISIVSIAIIFFGTNWFYYSIDSTGMSHSYSASLISMVFYISKYISTNNFNSSNRKYIILIFILSNIIILIRPTNIIIFPVLYIMCNPYQSFSTFVTQITCKINYFTSIAFILTFIIIWYPQFYYWNYAYNNYLAYSYGDEGFKYLKNPQILHLWFAPDNGFLLYSPLYIFVIISMIILTFNKSQIGFITLIFFIVISYIYSSWHAVSFGCSFGQRNYVDFAPLWCLLFGFFLTKLLTRKTFTKVILIFVIGLFSSYNIFLGYSHNKCFFSTTWDYKEYLYYFSKHWYSESFEMADKESAIGNSEFTRVVTYNKMSNLFKLKFAELSFEIKQESDTIKGLVRLELLKHDQIIFSSDNIINSLEENKNLWKNYKFSFEFPKNNHDEDKYRLVFCNPSLNDKYLVRNIAINTY